VHVSPIAGWYPDPAGSPDLRYWDGQAWSAETVPAAPAAVTTLPPVQPVQPVQPAQPAQNTMGFDYVLSAGTHTREPLGRIPAPRGSAYGAPVPSRFPQQKRKTRISGRIVAAGVAVVAALGGGYYLLNQHHGGPVRVSAHTTISMPSEVDGLPQVNKTETDEIQRVMNSTTVPKPHLIGFYGTSGENPAAFMMVAKYPQTADQVTHNLSLSLRSLDEQLGNLNFFQTTDPGPLGGLMRCASVSQGGSTANVCMFEDTDVIGLTFSYGTAADPGPDAITLRDAIEHRN
jgi:hypothetical protein